jgi:predicted DNA-binding transcriptional regulator AlpA
MRKTDVVCDERAFPLEGAVNLRQVQSVFPVSKTTIYKLMNAGSFPLLIKMGRSSYWDARAVREYLRSRGFDMTLRDAR